uniref:Uncharacterized protein n=1 Tax=Solanum tuberosum TaxID=4113 RepID=M1D2L8_SOLTU
MKAQDFNNTRIWIHLEYNETEECEEIRGNRVYLSRSNEPGRRCRRLPPPTTDSN